jgi:CRP/FNR family transcriptional regulator, cyclic AMP receptor protein
VSDSVLNELTSVPGFAGCSKKQLAMVDRLTYRVTVAPGKTVIRERTFGREAFVILSGTASVTRQGRLVTTLSAGDYFGEFAAIDTGRRNATLTALSALTVLVIAPREFSTLLADIPGFRDVLLRGMVKKLRDADETIETMRIVFQDSPMASALSNAPLRTAS